MKNLVNANEKGKSRPSSASHGESLISRPLWLIVLLLLIIVSIDACYDIPVAFSSGSQIGSLFSPGEVTRVKLENGMTLLLKQKRDIPLVSIFLCVGSGSVHEGALQGSGISHFIEHMVFKGTATRSSGDIFKTIESYGGDINAFTSYDYTGYKITVPAAFLNPALEVLADMMANAQFDQNELKKEKEVVLKEIGMNHDDPQRYVYRKLWQSAYSTHPYRYPILGEVDLFTALDRETLLNYYRQRYTPDKMVLCIVGDIDKEQTLLFAQGLFQGFLPPVSADPEIPAEPRQEKLRRAEESFTAGLTYLAWGFHSVALSDQDLCALDVLATVLGEGESSRLYDSLCRQQQLAYSVSAINYTPLFPGLFIISSLLDEDNRAAVEDLILQQIKSITATPVSSAELESAKNKIISDIIFYNQTLEAQARDLALNELLSGDYKFTQDYIENVQKVGAEDITRVAEKYLREDNLSIVALIPKDKGEKSMTGDTGRPFQIGIEQLSVEENGLSPQSEETAAPDPGKESAERQVKDPAPPEQSAVKKFVLDNGLTLLIKEDKDLPLVSIKAAFKGGLRAESEKTNGICNLVAKLLDKGTKTKDAEEIARTVESQGAHISGYSGNNSFFLSLDLLSRDWEQLLPLFADMIINPVFPQHEIDLQKEKNLAKLKSMEESVFESGTKLLKQKLFRQHPYRLEIAGNQKSLRGLSREDLFNFYKKYCVGKNMVLTVFGDVQTEEILSKVKQQFAALPCGEPVKIKLPLDTEKKSVRGAFQEMPKEQSLVLVGFPGATIYGDDRFALEIICQMLSQSSGRLFQQIREKAGQAYTLGAYQVLGLDPAYIVIYVATTKDSVEQVKEEVFKQLIELKQRMLDPDELEQLKRAIISERLISRQTNAECALESALDELYDLGFDYYQGYTDKIKSVTAQDIRGCARKYFTLDNYALVVVGPK